MTNAIASADLAANENAFRLVFHSIGGASPGNAAAIALGLGVPVTTVMEALYRAPSVLVDGLSETIGTRMLALLSEMGCRVSLDPMSAPLPEPATLFDVALHVTETTRYDEITGALAAFLGTLPGEAGRLISTPPGIILGKVSQASIDALSDRLGSGAELLASNPDTALYDVFLAPCDTVVKSRLLGDLRRRGLSILAEDGCLLAGLTKSQADTLWSTHQRIQELRVVNRDFLRFDLVLTGGSPTPEAIRALTEMAGIPADIVPRLFEEDEITVVEAANHATMSAMLEQLTAAGLEIRADLITFLHLGLEIIKAPRPHMVIETLRAIGIDSSENALRRLPYRLPFFLPELQARMLRDTLAWSGAETVFIDPMESEAAS